MKPEEFEVYVIPPNFMEGGTLFGGLLKTRNTVEAVILGLAVGVPVLHLPFSLTVRVVILCLTALPLVLLALIGVSGMSLSAFIRLFFCFLHNRRILSRDGTQGGKNGKTLLPSWAQQRKSDCEAEDPPLPKSRSRFSVDLKQRSVTQFKTFLQEDEAVKPLNALADYLGIPQKYYELMRTDAPELLAYNANYWFSQKNELRTLRTMDGCARAFLSNRYRRIDNLDIASVTLPVIGELPEARFVSTQITDDFMYIKVVNPRLQADVVPGDVVQAGVIISNSETGLGSVTIQPLIYRLVCSNGMVINDAKTRRNHVGRAATSEEDFSIYSNETLLADDHAFVLKIKDTVRAAISEARFAQVVSRMRESTEAMLDTKQLPAIVKLASSSFGITEDESNGVLEHLITGGDFSLYGLANAVTRFSQDVESYDRATKLEEIGYSVMTMSPALFRQMNRTELLAA